MISLNRISESLETEDYNEQVVANALRLLEYYDRSKIYVGKLGMANLDRYLHENLDKGLYTDFLPRGYSHIWVHNSSKTLEYSLLEGHNLENNDKGPFHTNILKKLDPPVVKKDLNLSELETSWYEQLVFINNSPEPKEKLDNKVSQKQIDTVVEEPVYTKQELWLKERFAIRIEEEPVPSSYFNCINKEITYLEEFNLQLDIELIRIKERLDNYVLI